MLDLNLWRRKNFVQKKIENYLELIGKNQNYIRWYRVLKSNKDYIESSIVHINLINDNFSIADLKAISREKKMIISLHDFWFVTGHCAYPTNCFNNANGCGKCPDLYRFSPMKRDFTKRILDMKKELLLGKNIFILVATNYVKNEILKILPEIEHKIRVIPLPINFKNNTSKIKKQHKKIRLGMRFNQLAIWDCVNSKSVKIN
jgi:hypothetical protein